MVDTDTQVELSEEDLRRLAPAQAREHIARLEEELGEMREMFAEVRKDNIGRHLQSIGLDAERGLGKAIARDYQGDVTPEALQTYAKEEYDYEQPSEGTSTQEVPEPNPVSDAIQAGTATVDQLEAQSQPATPPPDPNSLSELDRKMADPEATRQDASAAIQAKMEAFKKQMGIT